MDRVYGGGRAGGRAAGAARAGGAARGQLRPLMWCSMLPLMSVAS
jgi:hypothetical protein